MHINAALGGILSIEPAKRPFRSIPSSRPPNGAVNVGPVAGVPDLASTAANRHSGAKRGAVVGHATRLEADGPPPLSHEFNADACVTDPLVAEPA